MNETMELPEWFDGKKVNEILFSQEFLEEHPMVCVKGTFFTVEKRITDERELKKLIYDKLKGTVSSGVAKKLDSILEVLRSEAYVEDLPLQTDRIHVANGTLFLDGRYTEEKDYCRNRLTVAYSPDAPEPVRWLSFLHELLDEEAIPTLQEYMGYCLIPTTKAQKMLMLVGKGGEGKSRIGAVLRSILGDNMVNGNLNKVETNRFARADLEHVLLMVDDDMKTEGLPQTNYLKSIITAELPMDLEKKSQQSYQGELHCRFLGFGNGSLKALYDRSDGFFRRQIILTTRRKSKDRVDDPFLSEKLIAEKEGIFLWMLEGLKRLIANNYKFTISEKAKENMTEAVTDGNNIVEFMASEGYFRFKADYEVSTKDLYAVYKLWCEDNSLKPLSERSFSLFLHENEDRYNLEATNKIYIGNGRRVRGFLGIELLFKPNNF
ncbi:MAG: DNA primase [Oscillospiraceae bacterium]|nr:DNA primase [Oscillospiraceae bacterium]